MEIEKFSYRDSSIGEPVSATRLSDGCEVLAVRTPKGVVLMEPMGAVYKGLRYSEEKEILYAVPVTRPETIQKLEREVGLAEIDHRENVNAAIVSQNGNGAYDFELEDLYYRDFEKRN